MISVYFCENRYVTRIRHPIWLKKLCSHWLQQTWGKLRERRDHPSLILIKRSSQQYSAVRTRATKTPHKTSSNADQSNAKIHC